VRGTIALRAAEVSVGAFDADTTVRAVLDAGSFNTGNPIRDRAVRSVRYLNVHEHPDIEFSASSVRVVDGAQTANGSLTAHGVTVPLAVTVLDVGEDLATLTIHAQATVDRYAHGITAGKGLAGRYLQVHITAVARRR
jgi:polyisoprenoid-binding protein YceI